MKTKIISLLIIIAVAVVSCQKDENSQVEKLLEISFGIELVDPSGLKDGSPPECPVDDAGYLLVPTVAEIEIDGTTYYVDIFYIDGKYYTKSFKMAAQVGNDPNYVVSKFVLWTLNPVEDPVNAEIVMATPNAGSNYADFVSITVPFEIAVVAFDKLEFPITVLCFLESEYEQFGFIWFAITEIVVREFCFFGDICANDDPFPPSAFIESAYDDGDPGTPIPVDMHAIYQIHVMDANGEPFPAVDENIFSNIADPTIPLCVPFPDRIRVAEESFQFELWVLIPPAFEYVYFGTFDLVEAGNGSWGIYLDGVAALGEFNAVDFAIGSCSPFSDHIFDYPTAP